MNIGIEFILNSLDDYTILAKILHDDFLQAHPLFWRIDCLSLWYGEMREGIFSPQQLSAFLQNEIMLDTIRICGFRSKEDAAAAPRLKTYDEYVHSECAMAIRCVDSFYFNIYAKDAAALAELEAACRLLDCEAFRLVTEENDSLTSLLAY